MSNSWFVWEAYDAGSGHAFCDASAGLSETQKTALMLGRPMDLPLPTLEIESLTDGEIGDVLGTAWSSLIFSERVKDLLPKDIVQWIPVSFPIPVTRKYYVANFLELHEGIDAKKSTYQSDSNDLRDIHKLKSLHLKFKTENLPPIFRLDELPFVVLVSAQLRESIEKISPSPGIFITPNKYSFGYLP